MRALAVCFPPANGGDIYARLLRVLRASMAALSPLVFLDVIEDPGQVMREEPGMAEDRASFVANTHKLRLWNAAVQALKDGEALLLIDSDMVCCGDLSPAFRDWQDDITITVKDDGLYRFPFNSGVVGVRGGPRARAFFEQWWTNCQAMLRDGGVHQEWRTRYGGINQASLGQLLNETPELARVGRVPCRIWNAEESGWKDFGAETRMLHVKGRLRKAVEGRVTAMTPTVQRLKAVVEDWERRAA